MPQRVEEDRDVREKELNTTATNMNGQVRPANEKPITAEMVGLIRSLELEQELLT